MPEIIESGRDQGERFEEAVHDRRMGLLRLSR